MGEERLEYFCSACGVKLDDFSERTSPNSSKTKYSIFTHPAKREFKEHLPLTKSAIIVAEGYCTVGEKGDVRNMSGYPVYLLILPVGESVIIIRNGTVDEQPGSYLLRWDGKKLDFESLEQLDLPADDEIVAYL
jgi:hypothetical protein